MRTSEVTKAAELLDELRHVRGIVKHLNSRKPSSYVVVFEGENFLLSEKQWHGMRQLFLDELQATAARVEADLRKLGVTDLENI